MRLKDRIALVTGASGGLGSAISRTLAREGAQVVLAARREEPLNQLAQAISVEGGKALAFPADVTMEADVDKLVRRAQEEFGPIDLLVNTVGGYFSKRLLDTTPEEWDRMMGTKVRSAFLCSRAVLPGMLKLGRGDIISIASGGGKEGQPNFTAFCASEFALMGFTDSLAKEVEGKGIKVSVLCPMGVVDSEEARRYQSGNPDTWLDPQDFAEAVVFLASLSKRGLTTELVIRSLAPDYG